MLSAALAGISFARVAPTPVDPDSAVWRVDAGLLIPEQPKAYEAFRGGDDGFIA